MEFYPNKLLHKKKNLLRTTNLDRISRFVKLKIKLHTKLIQAFFPVIDLGKRGRQCEK